MQVSHDAASESHVLVNPKNSYKFEIAQTKEFFRVLSKQLYSDGTKAMIREVLCNAWDSHIASRITDIPIEITLNSDFVTIRDFGKGIPKDKMHPIYCVYGSSTKVNEDNQTGGFGLGSKAPWAHSNDFEVTSYNSGFKSIYSLSIGEGINTQDPTCNLMVEVPTEETGLAVKVPTLNYHKVLREIHNLSFTGGIKVKLNGEKLPYIDYLSNSSNYILIKYHKINNSSIHITNMIFIKYGSVIYPIPKDKLNEINLITNTNPIIQFCLQKSYDIIFIAPPNSISVTPSRESIEFNEITINTIKKLINDSLEELKIDNTYKINLDTLRRMFSYYYSIGEIYKLYEINYVHFIDYILFECSSLNYINDKILIKDAINTYNIFKNLKDYYGSTWSIDCKFLEQSESYKYLFYVYACMFKESIHPTLGDKDFLNCINYIISSYEKESFSFSKLYEITYNNYLIKINKEIENIMIKFHNKSGNKVKPILYKFEYNNQSFYTDKNYYNIKGLTCYLKNVTIIPKNTYSYNEIGKSPFTCSISKFAKELPDILEIFEKYEFNVKFSKIFPTSTSEKLNKLYNTPVERIKIGYYSTARGFIDKTKDQISNPKYILKGSSNKGGKYNFLSLNLQSKEQFNALMNYFGNTAGIGKNIVQYERAIKLGIPFGYDCLVEDIFNKLMINENRLRDLIYLIKNIDSYIPNFKYLIFKSKILAEHFDFPEIFTNTDLVRNYHLYSIIDSYGSMFSSDLSHDNYAKYVVIFNDSFIIKRYYPFLEEEILFRFRDFINFISITTYTESYNINSVDNFLSILLKK